MELLDEEDGNIPPGRNPLLINTVIKCIFEFLKLEDLKNCRRVCHQWNSIANPMLRKVAKIRFDSKHQPKDLLDSYFGHSDLPNLPFTSYKFSSYFGHSDLPNLPFTNYKFSSIHYTASTVSEIQDFCTKWGYNVKSLEFDFSRDFDMFKNLSPLLIQPLMSHLVELIVDYSVFTWETLAAVPTLKIVSLKDAHIKLPDNPCKIAPSKVSLVYNTFYEKNCRKHLINLIVNNLIDFSNCSEIKIFGGIECSTEHTRLSFDMAKDFVNAKKIHFCNIRPLNWRSRNLQTEHFILEDYAFQNKIMMDVKEMEFKKCSTDLAFLPNTIEKLTFDKIDEDVKVSGSVHFPNLKYLKLCPRPGSCYFDVYNVLPHFGNCLNLVDVELGGATFHYNKNTVLNLRSFPRSVKRLKIIRPAMLDLTGDDHIIVDVLILDDCPYRLAKMMMTKIKPKVLVMTLTTLIVHVYDVCRILWESEPKHRDVDDFICFVLNSSRLEKIIVKLHDDFKNVVEKSQLGKYVDQMAMYYEFQNRRGHAITKAEFEKYSILNK